MEEIFAFLEDMTKRLSRPIKDLDDIRLAMIALKEIREKEIKVDMCLLPIEVSKQGTITKPQRRSHRVTKRALERGWSPSWSSQIQYI